MLLFGGGITFISGGDPSGYMGPVFLIMGAVSLLIGILLLVKRSPKDPLEKWRTKEASQEDGLLKKLRKEKDDKRLMEIGKQAGLEKVAAAAFAGVTHQALLGSFVSDNIGATQRLQAALDCISDPSVLAGVVASGKSLSEGMRIQALSRIKDEQSLKSLAKNREKKISQSLRTEIYRRLMTVTKEQGADIHAVTLMLAGDREMPLEKRKQAYAELEAAGKDGDRLLAADSGMPAELRLQAYERCGDQENAKKMRRGMDQTAFLDSGRPSGQRAAAAQNILESDDGDWIEINMKAALSGGKNKDDVLKDFLVGASKKYPDIVKKMWPQISGIAHDDVTKHSDGHSDSVHTDYISDGTQGYRRGQHIDNKYYSDCSHSDSYNTNTHTDETDEGFLQKFAPVIREEDE